MPFTFFIIGTTLVIAGVRNTADDLFALVKGDFAGPNSYVRWFTAILIIGSLGYIEQLKPVSRAFLVLLLVALFLKNGTGFFARFNNDIIAPPSAG